MKKLQLAIALVLLASPAWAVIKNSPHDLASSSTATFKSTTVDRTCVFCHTPHYADTTQFGPLWNRTANYDFNGKTFYTTSSTLTAAAAGVNEAAMEATDAPLCMSCHDGALGDPMANVPTGYAAADFQDGDFSNGVDSTMKATALIMDAGKDLSNDHPIAFNYDTAAGVDTTGLHTLAQAKTNGVQFFGAGANMMWCSSCHDVHEYGAGGTVPFLIKSNAQSGLCLACHNK